MYKRVTLRIALCWDKFLSLAVRFALQRLRKIYPSSTVFFKLNQLYHPFAYVIVTTYVLINVTLRLMIVVTATSSWRCYQPWLDDFHTNA